MMPTNSAKAMRGLGPGGGGEGDEPGGEGADAGWADVVVCYPAAGEADVRSPAADGAEVCSPAADGVSAGCCDASSAVIAGRWRMGSGGASAGQA
jgi:hypothetical protein